MSIPYNSTVLGNPPVSAPLTAAAQTLVLGLNNTGNNSAMVQIWAGTSPTAVVVAFEGSIDGGTTYDVPLGGVRTDTGAIENGNITVSTIPSAWRLQVDQLTNVRVRLVSIGSGSINVAIKAGSYYSAPPAPQIVLNLQSGTFSSVTTTDLYGGSASAGLTINAASGAAGEIALGGASDSILLGSATMAGNPTTFLGQGAPSSSTVGTNVGTGAALTSNANVTGGVGSTSYTLNDIAYMLKEKGILKM